MIDDKTKKALEELSVEQKKYGNKLLQLQHAFQESLSVNAPNLYKEEGSGAMGRSRDFSFWLGNESYSVTICRTPDYDLESEIKIDKDIPIPDEDISSGSIH